MRKPRESVTDKNMTLPFLLPPSRPLPSLLVPRLPRFPPSHFCRHTPPAPCSLHLAATRDPSPPLAFVRFRLLPPLPRASVPTSSLLALSAALIPDWAESSVVFGGPGRRRSISVPARNYCSYLFRVARSAKSCQHESAGASVRGHRLQDEEDITKRRQG